MRDLLLFFYYVHVWFNCHQQKPLFNGEQERILVDTYHHNWHMLNKAKFRDQPWLNFVNLSSQEWQFIEFSRS